MASFSHSLSSHSFISFLQFRGSYILLVLSAWMLGIVATSVAICLGCLVKDVKQATELTPLIFVPQMLFAGFFTRTKQIPVWLRWAQVSYFLLERKADEGGFENDVSYTSHNPLTQAPPSFLILYFSLFSSTYVP